MYLKELRHSQQQLEKLWRGRQQKLDYWVKVKHYERDANTLNNDVKKWNVTWQKKELANDVNRALHMVERFENEYKDISERFFNLLKYGRELENNLLNSRIEVTITISDDAKKDGASYTADVSKKLQLEYDVVKKIYHKLKVKYEFSIKQRKLEADAKKVSSWIRHGESILAASQDAGYSMYEAEALLREYERFHVAVLRDLFYNKDARNFIFATIIPCHVFVNQKNRNMHPVVHIWNGDRKQSLEIRR